MQSQDTPSHRTPPKSPPPPEDLEFQDVQFQSTDVRLKQSKNNYKAAHPLPVNTVVKSEVLIMEFLFLIH
jgi:hypothetical protein